MPHNINFMQWWQVVVNNNQRGIFWVSQLAQNEQAWLDCLASAGIQQRIVISSSQTTNLSAVPSLLGQEFQAIILQVDCGLSPSLLAAAVGTLRSPGLLVVLSRPVAEWQQSATLFEQRLMAKLGTATTLFHVDNDTVVAQRCHAGTLSLDFDDTEQQQAIVAIKRVKQGQRRRPLLISADRGRGKSAALGKAIADLLRETPQLKCVVSGPSLASTRQVFAHAQQDLADLERQHDGWLTLPSSAGELRFHAVDKLLSSEADIDFVVVDEAAAIPLPQLIALLEKFPRIVFATTLHGYEGTGRGFVIKFMRLFADQSRGGRLVTLSPPCRWAMGDALEAWLNQLCLFQSEQENSVPFRPGQEVSISKVTQGELVAQEILLADVYDILMLAHYRTSPDDLRQLLDDPSLVIYIARQDNCVLGVAMALHEGSMSVAQAEQIDSGKSRPKGHLLPQLLAFQLNVKLACVQPMLRIMRVAVHPSAQRHGVGSMLIAAMEAYAKTANMAVLGASFGADAAVLEFWQKQAFTLLRIGFHVEKTSGLLSALMCKPLQESAAQMLASTIDNVRAIFFTQLPLLHVERSLTEIMMYLNAMPVGGPTVRLSAETLAELTRYATGQRPFEVCLPSLTELTRAAVVNGFPWQADHQGDAVLLHVFALHRDWASLIAQFDHSGRTTMENALKSAISNERYHRYVGQS